MKNRPSLKILHVLDHSLPLQSGYSFRSQNIFKSQLKRGWEPVIVTSPKHEESWRGPVKKLEEIEGFRFYRTGKLSANPITFYTEIHLMMALRKRIREVVNIERPDLLHAHSPVLNALPALEVGREHRIPVIYEIRAFWEDAAVDRQTYSEESVKYRIVKSLETWVCHQVDQVGVLCRGLRNDLIGRGVQTHKLSIIYNGINPDDFKLGESDAEYFRIWDLENTRVIGFIGSFYHYEGLDLLLEAFAKICRDIPEVRLLLIGGGEIEDGLKREIQNLNISKKVIMPGRIPHERIPGVYALIDALAYPRYSMRLTELVTPLKPLEAMAMGKALVASDIGGHRELIHHNETGLIFEAGSKSALVDSLVRLLNDQGLRQMLERQGYNWVRKNHTWDKTTAVYEEMYAKALKKYQVTSDEIEVTINNSADFIERQRENRNQETASGN